jgi:hypothetical protein
MSILPKAIYTCNTIAIKVPMTFISAWKFYPKVHLETQKTTKRQGNTEQKEQCCRCRNTHFKLYYRAIEIKTAWYWHKKQMWNRVEDMDMNPWNYAYLIFDKGAKNIW